MPCTHVCTHTRVSARAGRHEGRALRILAHGTCFPGVAGGEAADTPSRSWAVPSMGVQRPLEARRAGTGSKDGERQGGQQGSEGGIEWTPGDGEGAAPVFRRETRGWLWVKEVGVQLGKESLLRAGDGLDMGRGERWGHWAGVLVRKHWTAKDLGEGWK